MKQRDAVIQVMEENGGFATLSHLYQHALNVKGSKWGTKTPYNSIRRIVQEEKYFFKIEPGLWALNSYKDRLPFSSKIQENAPKKEREEFSHSYYQGLLVEIGNLENFDTFVPAQDKNRPYLSKKLGEVTTLKQIFSFGYPKAVNVASTIDVAWFNKREMPEKLIEVEHTTGFQNSLLKFVELQDFYVDFWIAAPEKRKAEYESKIDRAAFSDVKRRVKFVGYEKISQLHRNLTQRKFEIGI